ncbi:glucose-1-phosphate cytidylyltransferase [Roseococcus sp. SYP-B2431]|uniref:glucose-1-phosphate cytidylyltransferase n=1 Tax=Roseococcus sp. SYP-B2431 TaxID=2496640 RepID=UPI001038BB97|nr:glucose-1-phosphate cytidylyltransferase [Roseococcus sp. SYP-B2431]TCI00425.1 glucose-1-phosphate cytidylyltransferase [Roseococcus sp. SYP-B2431]
MQAVILAGGLGTRLSEETVVKPKPLVEIGGRPALWHIMKIYAAHGITDFIVCLGYKGHLIKEFFANYTLHMSDMTFDLAAHTSVNHRNEAENWRVTLVDTGEATMTGGRLARVLDRVEGDAFCLTYGDGVADVDIGASIAFHRAHGRLATVTAVYPPRRFGVLEMEGDAVRSFREKPQGEGGFINGGFFVLSPKVGRYLSGDTTVWEQEPLQQLAAEGELHAFRHEGFFQPMDTLRDRTYLEQLWASGSPPWKCW